MSFIWKIFVDAVNAPASISTNCCNGMKPKKFSITEQTPSLTSSFKQNLGNSKMKSLFVFFFFLFKINNTWNCFEFFFFNELKKKTQTKLFHSYTIQNYKKCDNFHNEMHSFANVTFFFENSYVNRMQNATNFRCCIKDLIMNLIFAQGASSNLKIQITHRTNKISCQSYLNIFSSWQTMSFECTQ